MEKELLESPVSGFETVVSLSREYGSTSKIPDELLAEAGYYRAENGNLAPIGFEVKEIKSKNELKPFDDFSITVDVGRVERWLGFKETQRFRDKLRDLDYLCFMPQDILMDSYYSQEEHLKFSKLEEQFRKLPTRGEFETALNYEIYEAMRDYAPTAFFLLDGTTSEPMCRLRDTFDELRTAQPEEPYLDELDDDEWLDDNNWVHDDTGDSPRNFSEFIERNRSLFTDVDILRKEFDENVIGFEKPFSKERYTLFRLAQDRISEDAADEIDVERHIDDLVELGIDTEGKLTMLKIGEVLDQLFPGNETSYANETIRISSSLEGLNYIEQLKTQLVKPIKRRIKEAAKELSLIPFGQPGRNEAESKLAEAKKAHRSMHASLQPLIDFFDRPAVVSKKLNQYFNDVQKTLHTAKRNTQTLTFVSAIDEELDANPGIVSGDCTAGKPLAFLDAGNGLFNVKVFSDGKHKGNIYLLQLVDKEQKPDAWHLDAIQIPIYANWDNIASKLVDALKQQAKERGVKSITINGESSQISNYDYIARAFGKLASWSALVEDEDIKLWKRLQNAAPKSDRGTEMQLLNTDGIRFLL